jgi:hypothetical protein
MWVELCVNLTLSFLYTKHVINGEQWKEGHPVPENHVFDRVAAVSVKGLYPRCACQLHSLE